MLVISTMAIIGVVLGFIGAGGSGFIIAILTVIFGIPIQTAFGTSLVAMVFTTFSGAYSHFQQNNVVVKIGIVIGLWGAIGSLCGTRLADLLPVYDLRWMTAGMLFLSALVLWFRMFILVRIQQLSTGLTPLFSDARFWLFSCFIGLVTGTLSGTFGIGSTPFIQIGLLTMFRLSTRQSAGTTMLVILPIALAGGIGYYSLGHLNFWLLFEVVLGTMSGAYIGAKLTGRVHPSILKIGMIVVPIIGGMLMII